MIVDPKGVDYTRYRGATLLTPNRRELAEASVEITKGLAKGFPVLLVYGNTDSVAPGSVGRSVGKALKAGRLAVRLEILKETDHKKVLSGACALAPGWAKKLR